MKTLMHCVAFLGICLTLGSCVGNVGNKAWYTFDCPEGGFRINMPEKPVKSDKVEVTAFGKQTVHFYTWKPKTFSIAKFKLFQISYTDCPPRYISDTIMGSVMLDSSIRMRTHDFTEKDDVKFEHIEINSYPGRAFFYDVPHDNNVVIVKQCFANNRRYDLVVVTKSDQGTNPEVAEFFDSFVLSH